MPTIHRYYSAEEAIQSGKHLQRQLIEAARRAKEEGRTAADQDFEEQRLELRAKSKGPHLLLIGGMGPLAGLEGFIRACELLGEDRPISLIQATAVPDRTVAVKAWLENAPALGEKVIETIVAIVACHLEALGEEDPLAANAPDSILLCNTSHFFLERVDQALRDRGRILGWLPLMEAAANRMRANGERQALILSTTGTRLVRLYGNVLESRGMTAVYPGEAVQELLMQAIYTGVKAMDFPKATSLALALAEALAQAHPRMHCLVAGCTEVPTLLNYAKSQAQGGTAAWLNQIQIIDPVTEVLLALRK